MKESAPRARKVGTPRCGVHSADRPLAQRYWLFIIAAAGLLALLFVYQRNRPPQISPIDRIVVEKSARKLSTFRACRLIKSYRIALGQNPTGTKEQEGDMKTPEGIYTVDGRNSASDFHLALHLSYPSAQDRAQAATAGVDPGCDIEIHGWPNGAVAPAWHPGPDWTAGCIALTNEEIEEIWCVTPEATIVEIRP